MDIQMKEIKDDLAVLNIEMAVVKANYSTKKDVAEAKHSIVMWVVSTMFLVQLLPVMMKKFGM
jgi:predicted Zn-dependent protease